MGATGVLRLHAQRHDTVVVVGRPSDRAVEACRAGDEGPWPRDLPPWRPAPCERHRGAGPSCGRGHHEVAMRHSIPPAAAARPPATRVRPHTAAATGRWASRPPILTTTVVLVHHGDGAGGAGARLWAGR